MASNPGFSPVNTGFRSFRRIGKYSTDRKWLVPHFEKMFYDNALLAYTYLEAYRATGNSLYTNIYQEIITYMLRKMKSPCEEYSCQVGF